MLHHAKLDKRFWGEAAMTAIHVKNRLPSPKLKSKTPFKIVHKSKPSVKHMRVFGFRAYVLTPKEKRLKWDPKSRVGVFVGYEEVSKAYRVYDIDAQRVVISRDVTFDESSLGDLSVNIFDDLEEANLDFDAVEISDDDSSYTTDFKQIGKRKDRSSDLNRSFKVSIPDYHETGLEEGSALKDLESRRPKRRLNARKEPTLTHEINASRNDDSNSTPPAFRRASANAVKAKDLSERPHFKIPLAGRISYIGARQYVLSWIPCSFVECFELQSYHQDSKPLEQSGCSRSSAKLIANLKVK